MAGPDSQITATTMTPLRVMKIDRNATISGPVFRENYKCLLPPPRVSVFVYKKGARGV
jgi:hypothetical protein